MKLSVFLLFVALAIVLETSSAAPIPWPRTSQDDGLASRALAFNGADQGIDSIALTRAVGGRSEQDRDLLLRSLDVDESSSRHVIAPLKERMISAMMPGVSFRDMMRWPWKKLFHKQRSSDLEEENDMTTRSQLHLNKSLEARGLLKKMASGVVKGARYITKKLRKNLPGTKDKIKPESQPATPGGVVAPQGSPASGHLSPASSNASPASSHVSIATQPASPAHFGSPAAPGSPAGNHISPAHERRGVVMDGDDSDKKDCQQFFEASAGDGRFDDAKHQPEAKRLVRTYKTAQAARKAVKWSLRWLLDRRYVNGRRLQLQRAQLSPVPLRRPRRTGSTSSRPPGTTSSRPPGNTSSRPHAHAERRSLHFDKRLIRTMKTAQAADKAMEKCIIWLYNRRYYNRRRRRPAQVEMTSMNAPPRQSGDTTAHPHTERSYDNAKRLVRTVKVAQTSLKGIKKALAWLRSSPLVRNQMLTAPLRIRRPSEKEDDVTSKATKD